MKYVFSLLALIVSGALAFLLYKSIEEPISFATEKTKRENAVQSKLIQIRQVQEIYKAMNGKYANNFDSLAYSLKNGEIEFIKTDKDPNFPEDQDKFIKTSTFSPAIDSVQSLGITDVDALRFVPFTDQKEEFSIKADTLTYQSTLVNVVEVGTSYNKFMGKYGDNKYKKYDQNFDLYKEIKFGDMTKPVTSGNW